MKPRSVQSMMLSFQLYASSACPLFWFLSMKRVVLRTNGISDLLTYFLVGDVVLVQNSLGQQFISQAWMFYSRSVVNAYRKADVNRQHTILICDDSLMFLSIIIYHSLIFSISFNQIWTKFGLPCWSSLVEFMNKSSSSCTLLERFYVLTQDWKRFLTINPFMTISIWAVWSLFASFVSAKCVCHH